jgi:hypothetical protein
MISFTGSAGLRFEGLRFTCTSATYAGRLVACSGGGVRDTSNFAFDHCMFQGFEASKSATALLSIKQAIIGTIEHCTFAWAATGIELGNDSYAVNIAVRDCTWILSTMVTWCMAVTGGAESLLVENCTFEGLFGVDNKAGGLLIQTSSFSSGVNIIGNWFGDAASPPAVGGGEWIKVGPVGVLGLTVIGNRFGPAGATASDLSIYYCEGALIAGNRMESGTSIAFPNATNSRGVSIIGNVCSAPMSGVANILTGVILGNNGIANKFMTSQAAQLDLSGLRVTGNGTPVSGAGVETLFDGTGVVYAYDRSAATYRPMRLDGSTTELQASGTTRVKADATGLGFFGAAPVAKPTGVPVTAAGIHAALVSLGLIS